MQFYLNGSVFLLNKKYIYFCLKCIVSDKLLKLRQSFWITLYMHIAAVLDRIRVRLDPFIMNV